MPPKSRLFIVIHTILGTNHGLEHAIEQTAIAKENGANGIFLIPDYEKGHLRATTKDQFHYVKILKETFPHFLIGVNFLSNLSRLAPHIYDLQPNLLQTDGSAASGLDKMLLPETDLFCGVAFKYSKNENLRGDLLKEHCLKVAHTCDVPTTSGTATGVSANLEKIKEIKSYLPTGKRFGIASGVDNDNLESYLLAGVTDFLVATSLVACVDEFSCDILSASRVLDMSKKIHSI